MDAFDIGSLRLLVTERSFLDTKTENYERRESWSFISDFSTSIVRLARLRGTESDEKRGGRERERENIAEIRAITNDDNNYAPVFIVTRHATEILLSTVVFSSPSLLLFFLVSRRRRRRRRHRDLVKKEKRGRKKNHSPLARLNLASLMTESGRRRAMNRSAKNEACRAGSGL